MLFEGDENLHPDVVVFDTVATIPNCDASRVCVVN
jgi:hypothetical protein